MSEDLKTLSLNGFIIQYIHDKRVFDAEYNGRALSNLIEPPAFHVDYYNPINSKFDFDSNLIELSDHILDTVKLLNERGDPCVAAMFGSYYYEILGRRDMQFKVNGCHILNIPFWLSVLTLVKDWKQRNNGFPIHMGTPLYFLAEAYILVQNNDLAFIYLIKSIVDDIKLSKSCPGFQYPQKEPAYLTVCLVDNANNHMYSFIVKPLREFLEDAIKKYNILFGNESYLKKGLVDFDLKFLQKRNTKKLNIEFIKFLFVLELLQLLRLKNIVVDKNYVTPFSQMLLLNRLFSLTLVIDKLLHSRYPSKRKKRGKDASMWQCILVYANSHGIPAATLEKMNLNSRDLEVVLRTLLQKKKQKYFRILKREIVPILIAYKIRNTSAHKLHAAAIISSKMDEILQSLMEAVFTITGQIPNSK